jgi:hypothetical protein
MNAAAIDSLGERIVLAGAAFAAVIYLARMVYKAIKFAQRIERVVHSVEEQLYPNGGSSLRDAVNAIQHHLGIPVNQPPDR